MEQKLSQPHPLLFTLDFLHQEALAIHAVADLHATAAGSF
jgi:hypothetical protein